MVICLNLFSSSAWSQRLGPIHHPLFSAYLAFSRNRYVFIKFHLAASVFFFPHHVSSLHASLFSADSHWCDQILKQASFSVSCCLEKVINIWIYIRSKSCSFKRFWVAIWQGDKDDNLNRLRVESRLEYLWVISPLDSELPHCQNGDNNVYCVRWQEWLD